MEEVGAEGCWGVHPPFTPRRVVQLAAGCALSCAVSPPRISPALPSCSSVVVTQPPRSLQAPLVSYHHRRATHPPTPALEPGSLKALTGEMA